MLKILYESNKVMFSRAIEKINFPVYCFITMVISLLMFVFSGCSTKSLSIIEYARVGDLEGVEKEIIQIKDVNMQKNGQNALLWAAINGDYHIIRLLINAGADVNVFDNNFHTTPLMYAAIYGYIDIAELLIKARANINEHQLAKVLSKDSNYTSDLRLIESKNGNTALTLAIKNNHIEIVELLLKNGADLINPVVYENALDEVAHWKKTNLENGEYVQKTEIIWNNEQWEKRISINDHIIIKHSTGYYYKGNRLQPQKEKVETPLSIAKNSGNEEIIHLISNNLETSLDKSVDK